MLSLTQRLPIGQEIPPFSIQDHDAHNEQLLSWAPFFQLFAQMEQRMEQRARQLVREEFKRTAAEQIAAAAEVDKNNQILTVNQAAEALGVRPQTAYEWIKAGKLNVLRTGKSNRTLRLKWGDVQAALQTQTQPNGRRKYARRSSFTPVTR